MNIWQTVCCLSWNKDVTEQLGGLLVEGAFAAKLQLRSTQS